MIRFRKCGMSAPAVIYLSCLAVVDTSYLVWVILLDLCLTFLTLQPFWHSNPWWCATVSILQYGAFYSCAWIVVVFTIERYLVLSSTAAKQRFTRSRTTVLTCVGVVLVSHLASVPMGWVYEVTTVTLTLETGNVTLPRCLYRETLYSTAIVWVTSFLSAGIPIVLVIIYNSLIAYHLCRSSRLFTKEERRTIRGSNTRGMVRRTIILLGTVSVTFVVLSLPRFITYCILRTRYNHADFDRNDYGIPINVASDLANMLHNLNSTTNFLLYCMVSRRFRQELLSTLACRARPRDLSSILTQNTMRVFSVARPSGRRPLTLRDPVHVVLTDHKQIQAF